MVTTYMPDADRAYVEPRKLTHYLLNPQHPVGSSKAKAFLAMGYTQSFPEQLESALLRHATQPVASVIPTRHGELFVIEAYLSSDVTEIRVRFVRSVWLVELGRAPKFITAYPIQRVS